MKKKDFVTVRDLSTREIREIFSSAVAMKANPAAHREALRGKSLAMFFEKPSLRTRISFDVGIHQLGGFAIYLTPAEINLGRRESVHDVAKNLERMVDGIMMRTFSHEVVEQMAEHTAIPVINGLTDFNHPCQAMADYMTILEIKEDFQGLKIAYVGDGNNVVHSLINGAARLGLHLSVATPAHYEPKADVVEWAREQSSVTGCSIDLTQDPWAAVEQADVIYTDVWASMGQESEAVRRRDLFRPYQVNEDLFNRAKPDAVFMHCLPAHRGDEVTDAVIDSSRSVVFSQAENRLHVQKAIMLHLMG